MTIFGGGRTPDDFPGERIEEAIKLLPMSASLPTVNGEIFYVSGSVSGSGFFFHEEGVVKRLGIDEPTHEFLNSLAHDSVSASYDVATYNTVGLTSMTVWTDSGQTTKLQDYVITYNAQRLITALTSSTYYSNGSIKSQLLEVPSYDSRKRITAITRTRVVLCPVCT